MPDYIPLPWYSINAIFGDEALANTFGESASARGSEPFSSANASFISHPEPLRPDGVMTIGDAISTTPGQIYAKRKFEEYGRDGDPLKMGMGDSFLADIPADFTDKVAAGYKSVTGIDPYEKGAWWKASGKVAIMAVALIIVYVGFNALVKGEN